MVQFKLNGDRMNGILEDSDDNMVVDMRDRAGGALSILPDLST